jgi:hypothetical protein
MSKRLVTLLTAITTSILLSTTASFAEVRDHRNTGGQTYVGSRGGGGCYNCARTSTASGGVVVTQGGKVVPTQLAPPSRRGGGGGGGK